MIRTDQFAWGTGACYFDGTAYLTAIDPALDFLLGTQDFTIEFFYRPDVGSTGMRTILDMGTSYSASNMDFRIEINAGGVCTFLGGPNLTWFGGTQTVALGGWNHSAFVRAGNFLLTFFNGTLVNTQSAAPINILHRGNEFTLGATCAGSRTNYFKGYIDEFRITRGVARYLSSFVPIAPFPDPTVFRRSVGTPVLSPSALSVSSALRLASGLSSSPAAQAIAGITSQRPHVLRPAELYFP